MNRKQIVAGNWKMNLDFNEGRDLSIAVLRALGPSDTIVIFCPPFIHLNYISMLTNGVANVSLGAQNCHTNEGGAYTGEISAPMLKSVGCEYVIIGHSERRAYFGEDNETLASKVNMAIKHGLQPIFCCGEKLEARENGTQEKVVEEQLAGGLFHLDAAAFANAVIAYEPVWAIGTGKTASPDQAQDMHAHIRKLVTNKYGEEIANGTSILYGGSCKPGNAKELFAKPDVDGGLIGGASLKAADFVAIAGSFPAK